MERHTPDTPQSKTAKQPSSISTAIDASFEADASVRQALTENLKPLRAESEAIAARLHKAFEKFDPSSLSVEERARRHYVAPGADPSAALNTVIMSRVESLRTSADKKGLTLRDSAELRALIQAPEGDAPLRGVVELSKLISFLDRKSLASSLVADSDYTPFTAEIEAKKLLGIAGKAPQSGTGQGTAARKVSALEAREVDQLVKDSVNVQMKSVTAPESELSYGKIPNTSNEDEAQRGVRETFQLRLGASDVTAYHDFHTLQIAFQHVWTRIFDGQLTSLGRDLYREYVRLKDFTGSTAPDIQVGTLSDLRRLIDEVKKLSQFVDEDIPAALRPAGSEPKNNGLPTPTPEDVARGAGAVLTLGASLFIEWAINEVLKLGNRPVAVTWNDFPLKLNEAKGNVIELQPPVQNALPQGSVEIVLETDAGSFKKMISFQEWDQATGQCIYRADLHNFGGGDRLVLNTARVPFGTLVFISEDEFANHVLLGRYVLGNLTDRLKDRARVTIRWKGQR